MSFERQLQRHQKRLGYTDAQMCAALDVGDSTYRSWRKADPKRTPTAADLERMAAAEAKRARKAARRRAQW